MKVLVCGGRNYRDWTMFSFFMDALEPKPTVIIHGGAEGADFMAGKWATIRQVAQRVHEADWDELGRAAGPIRNQEMLDVEKPDLVVAFPGGRGTADMKRRARDAGVKIIEPYSRASQAG